MSDNVFLEATAVEEEEERLRNLWLEEERVPILAQGAKVDHVELEAYVDELLRRGRAYLREYAHNEALYQRRRQEMLNELDDWRYRVQHPVEQRLRWLEGMMQPLFRMLRTGKKKSKALPNGTIGVRKRPAQVEVVDKERAVLFCEKNGLPIKKDVYKTPLKQYAEEHGGIDSETGVVYVPAQEDGTFYWKTPEHALLKKAKGNGEEEAE